MHAHICTLAGDVRPCAARRTQGVDYAVLELQGPEVRVRDRGVAAAELTREGGRGPEVQAPVDLAHRSVELLGVARRELGELEEHAIRDARPQAGAVGALQRAAEGHATGALAQLQGAQGAELTGQQVGKTTRCAGKET